MSNICKVIIILRRDIFYSGIGLKDSFRLIAKMIFLNYNLEICSFILGFKLVGYWGVMSRGVGTEHPGHNYLLIGLNVDGAVICTF